MWIIYSQFQCDKEAFCAAQACLSALIYIYPYICKYGYDINNLRTTKDNMLRKKDCFTFCCVAYVTFYCL